MAIDWQRPEYIAELPRWSLVDDMVTERNLSDYIPDLDVLKGSQSIKGEDGIARYFSTPDDARNREFKGRASFFGASQITLEALIGIAFERDPQITLPSGLEYLLKNVDGSGVDMWQQMQEAVSEALKKSRGGLYVTMPRTEGNSSLADQEALRSVATVHLIDAKRIINWWTAQDGAETYLKGVVFTDSREVMEDYEIKVTPTRRELAIDDAGNFFDRTWVETTDAQGAKTWQPEEPVYPTNSRRQPFQRIPFLFFGARRNHWDMQVPPLLSLARKNRDHFRNSAINEEGIWFSGHIQPVADEMDPEALDVISQDGFKIGGGHLMIAKGFRFEVAEPNTAARQGMIDKAEEMAALGAKIIQPGTVAKTATQDAGEQRTQHSVLSLACVNIEDAYQWAIERVSEFMGVTGEVEVKMNRAFMEPVVTAEKMREMRENLLAGVVGSEEMFRVLQRSGDIDPEKTLDEYREEVAERGLVLSAEPDETDLNADA